jgi:Mannosylglycerate hydrolase MGH1-like glycoside hydrolase domain
VLAVVPPDRLRRILARVFDEDEFLSPYGLRSLSRYHERLPFELVVNGAPARVDYEPGESTTPLFGGNSNWRGPIWMPLNYLTVQGLRAYSHIVGRDLEVELPTRSGNMVGMAAAGDELARRVTSIFLAGEDGRRPVLRSYGSLQDDPDFRDLVPFHEYFHADTGAGLGASHQTGWTGLVAMLLTSTTALRTPAR